ncbi:uncharacterized protein TEOVI_000182500 [Trypanosoma equiperdum]|uniref:Uncharacterized protein n=2 Tax=Trypanozoon TaxID=39700 RepID=Q57TU6_TRYB2|nr:hypothetical protein, conserved [Trypanosoma brucei brucei TREU927]AAX80028.1 hypothetical protein, conserved [Trypanosoma brucei]AAZ13431.1 hypothetical protein, conserved [Trypanosoma brucei brucei TREU927]SCU70252.1 hypothetical protein, conserved [Trypanosoma equiperdum]
MAAAPAELILQELDAVLHRANKTQSELYQRVAVIGERIRSRQVLTRADELTQLARADILRRCRAIQQGRNKLLQTLRHAASLLATGDVNNLCGRSNTDAVLSTINEAAQVEHSLSRWQQPSLNIEAWRNVVSSGPQDDMAMERLLHPSGPRSGGDGNELPGWIYVPCICSIVDYCRVKKMPSAPGGSCGGSSGNGKRKAKGDNSLEEGHRGGEEASDVDGFGSNSEDVAKESKIALLMLQAAATAVDELIQRTEDEQTAAVGNGTSKCTDEEEEEAKEKAVEEKRLRVCIEIAAKAAAYTHAVKALSAGEDSALFDGVSDAAATVASLVSLPSSSAASLTHGVPVELLVLPPMESLFYCIAYTVGAAILRDEQNELRLTAPGTAGLGGGGEVGNYTESDGGDRGGSCATASAVACNEEEEVAPLDGITAGWRGDWEMWLQRSSGADCSFLGPRLLQYLLEYVFFPTGSAGHVGTVSVAPEAMRRWLMLACGGEAGVDGTVDTMMSLFMGQ